MDLSNLRSFLNDREELLLGVSFGSAVLLGLGALLGPWLILRLPSDAFSTDQPPRASEPRNTSARLALLWIRNLLGAMLVLVGFILLVLPGQGLLTIVAGAALLRFPGKEKIARRFVTYPTIWRSLNWFRSRFGQPPFHS